MSKIYYVCKSCGARKVRLWKPKGEKEPLICAKCAEVRQVPMSYPKIDWEAVDDARCINGTFNGEYGNLDPWNVDENGQIPWYMGPVPEEAGKIMTDQLMVDISDISNHKKPILVYPAELNEAGDGFIEYDERGIDDNSYWNSLPTTRG